MRKLRWLSIALAAALSAEALAQPPPERLRDRARTFLVLRLAEALDLTDEEALRASRIFREAEERRRTLEEERQGIEKELRAELASATPDRKKIASLVERAVKIDEELAAVPSRAFAELRSSLAVEKQAKLVLARPLIQREVRGALLRRLGSRWPADKSRWGPPSPREGPPPPRPGAEPGTPKADRSD
jgi:hypothetical protein